MITVTKIHIPENSEIIKSVYERYTLDGYLYGVRTVISDITRTLKLLKTEGINKKACKKYIEQAVEEGIRLLEAAKPIANKFSELCGQEYTETLNQFHKTVNKIPLL